MSAMVINTGNCGGDFSRRVAVLWATKVAPTKAEQEVWV